MPKSNLRGALAGGPRALTHCLTLSLAALVLLAGAGLARAEEPMPGSSSTHEDYVRQVAVAGDEAQRANDALRAINRTMRENYGATLQWISGRIDPAIVVQFDGEGGTFHLRDGTRHVVAHPVPVTYELMKDVGHIPIAIYAVIAPYLQSPAAPQWQDKLRTVSAQLHAARAGLDTSALKDTALEQARYILDQSAAFTDEALKAGTFTIEGFQAYARRILPANVILRTLAAETQMVAVVELLETWRDEVGPDRWKNLSAVVIAPFTIGSETPNLQALRFVMDPEKLKDRLIVVGGDFGADPDRAVGVFARLYMDRLGSRLVFGLDHPDSPPIVRALSSQRDFLADPAEAALRKIADQRAARQK